MSQRVRRKLAEVEGVCFDNLEKQVIESLMVQMSHSGAWHIQEVVPRTALASPPATPISYMPIGRVSNSLEICKVDICLILACPVLNIFNIALTADIDIFTGLYQHITGRDDIGDRRNSRILSC